MDMADRTRLDAHKLHLHPQRVADYLTGCPTFPLYVEISLTNRCNLRCRFCALEYRQERACDLELPRLLQLIDELGAAGVRSVCLAGEGEPMLYEGIAAVVERCAARGIDCAVATNGTVMPETLAALLVRHLTWIKISLNAIHPETYCRVHGCPTDHLPQVLQNIAALVTARRAAGGGATIGVQAVLLPENADEMVEMATRLRDTGIDYFVIKPFNRNLNSGNTAYCDIDYRPLLTLAAPLEALSTATYRVQFRAHAIGKVISGTRSYGGCHGINFFALLHSDGGVYTCAPHSGEQASCYGNIYNTDFRSLWMGERRRNIVRYRAGCLDGCPPGCRLDEINRYLWELQHPGPHANFI